MFTYTLPSNRSCTKLPMSSLFLTVALFATFCSAAIVEYSKQSNGDAAGALALAERQKLVQQVQVGGLQHSSEIVSTPSARQAAPAKGASQPRWCNVHVFKKSRVTWLEAYKSCRSMGNGTELASVKTDEDYKLIASKVREAGSPWQVIYWTSGIDLIDEGEYVWMADGTPVTKTYWATGQPDNHWDSEHCVALKRLPHERDYRMTDENCLLSGAYVCTQPCVFWKA